MKSVVPNVMVIVNEHGANDLIGGMPHGLKAGDKISICFINAEGTRIQVTGSKINHRLLSIKSVDLPALPQGYPETVPDGLSTNDRKYLENLAMLHRIRPTAMEIVEQQEAIRARREAEEAARLARQERLREAATRRAPTKQVSKDVAPGRTLNIRPCNVPPPARGRQLNRSLVGVR